MSSKKAIAMVFENIQEPFSNIEFDLPVLYGNEVLVKIEYSTICTSDLHTFYGRRNSKTNSILGHEIIGKIEKLPKVKVNDFYGNELKLGDRVTWSVYAHDANDEFVKKGIPQKSKSLFKYGHEEINELHQLNGGFASHCHLKEGTTIFKIPSNLSSKEAAPINCTHATIAGAIRLAGGNFTNKNVLICGVGMLGLSACAMAKELGAKTVFSMDVDNERLKNSKQFGVDVILNSSDKLEKLLKKCIYYGGIDIVIETSGVSTAIENTLKILNIGGVSVLVGSVYSQRDININAEYLVRNLLTIKGLHNYIHEDLGNAIKFIAQHNTKYPFEKLVGGEYNLKKLDDAFDYANTNSCYRIGVFQGD